MAVKSLVLEINSSSDSASIQSQIDTALSDAGVDKADFIDVVVISEQQPNQPAVIIIFFDG